MFRLPGLRSSDLTTLILGAGSTICTILSFGLLPLWVDRADLFMILGLAPLALSQNLFEAGLVFRIADSLESFQPRQNLRSLLALPFLGVSVMLYLGWGMVAFGYLASIVVKTLVSMAFLSMACRARDFNYERVGRFLAALITLIASLAIGLISLLRHQMLESTVPLWINIQLMLGVLILSCLWWKVWSVWLRHPIAALGFRRLQLTEDAWLFSVSLTGLLMYSWWPLYFSIHPSSTLSNHYNQLGFFYLCYSLVGPLVLKKAIFEFRLSDKLYIKLVGVLRGINLVLLTLMLYFAFGLHPGRFQRMGPVFIAGIFVLVNEGFASTLFPTRIVGYTSRVAKYSCAIFTAVLLAALLCEFTHLSFPIYVAILTNLVGWTAYSPLKAMDPMEGAG